MKQDRWSHHKVYKWKGFPQQIALHSKKTLLTQKKEWERKRG